MDSLYSILIILTVLTNRNFHVYNGWSSIWILPHKRQRSELRRVHHTLDTQSCEAVTIQVTASRGRSSSIDNLASLPAEAAQKPKEKLRASLHSLRIAIRHPPS